MAMSGMLSHNVLWTFFLFCYYNKTMYETRIEFSTAVQSVESDVGTIIHSECIKRRGFRLVLK